MTKSNLKISNHVISVMSS